MDEFLKFWHKFNEDFEDYTKADDSRLANKKLKAELDKLAKENGIKIKGAANNDDLLQYSTYVIASVIAVAVIDHVGNQLYQEAVFNIKFNAQTYENAALKKLAKSIKDTTKKLANKLKKHYQIKNLVNGTIDKTLWSDRIWSNMDALRSDLTKTMKNALLTHTNPVTQTNELRKKFGVARYQAERILRTESSRVMAQSGIESVKQAGYEKVVWVANSKACDECQSHIGEVYTLKKAQGVLPFHPSCRCAWSAYVD
ncbi:phage head morphogenesis protein [Lactobacillus sp. UCMA15818]|nr:phage head morphogenesis protein [Lactobacillus sp. UCMA15818]